MDMVLKLATEFRNAIEAAKDAGEFQHDICFHKFPTACCGDASELLGQYLLDHGIHSRYVCGTHYYGETSYDSQSHAWLLLDDGRIADITADQFYLQSMYLNYDRPVYVGKMDTFHKLFKVDPSRDIHDNVGVRGVPRLPTLYQTIRRYIHQDYL